MLPIPVYSTVWSSHTALASPDGRGTSRREGERDVQTVRAGMQFRIRNRCSGSEGSLSVESVQWALSGASRQLSRRESQGHGEHRWPEGSHSLTALRRSSSSELVGNSQRSVSQTKYCPAGICRCSNCRWNAIVYQTAIRLSIRLHNPSWFFFAIKHISVHLFRSIQKITGDLVMLRFFIGNRTDPGVSEV